MRRNRLVIMLKEPRAGQVKTRLGRDIGMTTAAWWFRHHSARLLRTLQDPRWELRLSVAPAPHALTCRAWPAHIPRAAQIRGDLGARMRHILETTPAGPVLLMGSDILDVTPAIIQQAFSELGTRDFVFGPATDGGFWLAGAKRAGAPLPARLFENVRWSSEHTLADTLETLGNAPIGFAQERRDVDTIADLYLAPRTSRR